MPPVFGPGFRQILEELGKLQGSVAGGSMPSWWRKTPSTKPKKAINPKPTDILGIEGEPLPTPIEPRFQDFLSGRALTSKEYMNQYMNPGDFVRHMSRARDGNIPWNLEDPRPGLLGADPSGRGFRTIGIWEHGDDANYAADKAIQGGLSDELQERILSNVLESIQLTPDVSFTPNREAPKLLNYNYSYTDLKLPELVDKLKKLFGQ